MTITVVVSPDLVGVKGGTPAEMKSALGLLFDWLHEDRRNPGPEDKLLDLQPHHSEFKTIKRLKPRLCACGERLPAGAYFIRADQKNDWTVFIIRRDGDLFTYPDGGEILGPITPDMVM